MKNKISQKQQSSQHLDSINTIECHLVSPISFNTNTVNTVSDINLPTFSSANKTGVYVEASIKGILLKAMIDSGSGTNIIPQSIVEQHKLPYKNQIKKTMLTAGGITKSLGELKLIIITLNNQQYIVEDANVLLENENLILGNIFLYKNNGSISYSNKTITLYQNQIKNKFFLYYSIGTIEQYSGDESEDETDYVTSEDESSRIDDSYFIELFI